MATGVQASKLAIAAFLVPYIFVLSPSLLMINATPLDVLHMIVSAVIGMIGVGGAVSAYLITRTVWLERIALFSGGFMLIYPGIFTDLAGAGVLVLVYISQRIRFGRHKSSAVAS